MSIGAYSKGWGDPNEYDDYGDGSGNYDGDSGGITLNERLYRFRFSIPEPAGTDRKPNLVNPGTPATKRVLFLDNEPFRVYEHGFWHKKFKNAYKILSSFTGICPEKNGLTKRPCLICSKKGGNSYPYYIGFFPVIDMGQVEYRDDGVFLHHEYWIDSKGEKHERAFQRVLLGAKRGSIDKPGILKTLQLELNRIRSQYGINDLMGTVWDTTRIGKKDASVGSSWKFIEKIEPNDFVPYLVSLGADPEELNVDIPVYLDEKNKTGVFDIVDVDEYCKKLEMIVGLNENQGNINNNRQQSGVRATPVASGVGFGGQNQPPRQQTFDNKFNNKNNNGSGYRNNGPNQGYNHTNNYQKNMPVQTSGNVGYANNGYGAPPPDDDDIPF